MFVDSGDQKKTPVQNCLREALWGVIVHQCVISMTVIYPKIWSLYINVQFLVAYLGYIETSVLKWDFSTQFKVLVKEFL